MRTGTAIVVFITIDGFRLFDLPDIAFARGATSQVIVGILTITALALLPIYLFMTKRLSQKHHEK